MNRRNVFLALAFVWVGGSLLADGWQRKSRDEIVRDVMAMERRVEAAQAALKDRCRLTDYVSIVRTANGTNVWTDALRQALKEHEVVVLPSREEPYCFDGQVVVPSNRRIEAHGARTFLMAPCDVCLLRNEHVQDGYRRPVDGSVRDRNIAVVGGVWESWADRRMAEGRGGRWTDGRERGGVGCKRFLGLSGHFYFGNVVGVTVKDIVFRSIGSFALQAGDAEDVVVRHLTFERCRADGFHCNGNVRNVHVEDLSGGCGDDLLALNFCDWPCSSVNFGPGDTILAEKIHATSGCPWLRIFPAVHIYGDGTKVDCAARNLVIRDVRNVSEFKLYLQTRSYRIGGARDPMEVGSGGSIWFEDIQVGGVRAPWRIAANLTDVHFRSIDARKLRAGVPLVEVGGISSYNAARKIETFDPWVVCKVGTVEFADVDCPRSDSKVWARCLVYPNPRENGDVGGHGEIGETVVAPDL